MEVELSEIYINGIMYLKDNFETRAVRGLFGGSMFHDFSGSLCSGHIAGGHAAAFCAEQEVPAANESELDAELEAEKARVFRPLHVRDGIRQEKFEAAIRQVMNYYMGYVRSGKSMETALAKLAFVESKMNEVTAANLHELMRAHESFHLLRTCILATMASLERRETRFVYRRSDYPEADPSYDDRLLVVCRKDGAPRCEWRRAG